METYVERDLRVMANVRDLSTFRRFLALVVGEVLKAHFNRGLRPPVSFYRDSNGNEVDLLIEQPAGLRALEIKAGQTVTSGYFKGLRRLIDLMGDRVAGTAVLYAGDRGQSRSEHPVHPILDCDRLLDEWLPPARV